MWDESGGVTLQFLGRREITGLEVGSQLKAEGMVGENNGQLIILNPSYEIVVQILRQYPYGATESKALSS